MIKKKLHNALAKGVDLTAIDFSSIFTQFHEGVLIADKDGVIIFYAASMGEIDDIDPDYPIGKTILEVYDLTAEQSPTMRCLASRKPIINEPLFYRTHLGKVTNGFLNVYPIFHDGDLFGAICLVNEFHQEQKKFSTPRFICASESETKNGTRFSFADIIGRNTDLVESVRIARMAAESSSPVLIVGDTGTGKELFAQSIHNSSSFSGQAFIPINCAAIPENLLEGILFGTSKGAFTGSVDKAGLFEEANGGTLFLDELNSMPIALQTKMLRVIQEKKVRRVGSQKEIGLNLKIISSVNQDPLEEIRVGKLRRDLFYRLGVIIIQLPTLGERMQDLMKLVYHFIDKFNTRLKKQVSGISPRVKAIFTSYHWPGNVRELEHVIEGTMNLVGKEHLIEENHLPQYFLQSVASERAASSGNSQIEKGDSLSAIESSVVQMYEQTFAEQESLQQLKELHDKAEKQIIRRALTASEGNVSKAVRLLGLSSPQALQYKMKKLNFCREEFFTS